MFVCVDTSITIRAPASAIWDFAAVPENWTRSNPAEHFGLRYDSANDRPGRGVEFVQRESVASLRCELRGRLHHFDRPRLAFWTGIATYRLLGGLLRIRLPEGGVLRVDEVDEGTRLAHDVFIDFPDSLAGRIARWTFLRVRDGRQAVFDHAQRELRYFKRQLETQEGYGDPARPDESPDSARAASAAAASRPSPTCGIGLIQENTMLEFEVKDMMCDHCVSSITKALRKADATSQVEFDMLARRVRVAGALDAQSASQAIKAAGYTPVAVQSS